MVRGDPCNSGNFMGARSSSRVLAQPGGNSSFSLGWDEPAPKVVRPAAQVPQPVPEVDKENEQPVASTNSQQAMVNKRTQSSNAWASNSNQNCGNMITDRPSTRVHAPPGGKSSISF
eukprot:TRINITY_DN7586_c0_g1_i1.p2 TRINITY_DN7586_c0_g1~~TRINITY_DN7586_c0_g1_i1.p2  ORF type:complete len:117 (+),score=28.11 TRINITY_DN7586_c0_g1_i1:68-418(+)